MGWYDAYKPTHVNRVNVLPMTSNSGSAAKNFGDAFTKIGDSMLKVDKAREDEKLNNTRNDLLTTQNLQNKKLLNAFDTTNALKNDALKANIDNTRTGTQLKKKKVNVFDENNQADLDYKNATINSTKIGTQLKKKKVNVFDENNQADLDFKNANTAYTKKKTSSYDKLIASKLAKNSKPFKYTEATDAKIASQVKTAMGMDTPNFNFDDSVKKQYQDTVAGAAQISKKFNLEPSLAIEVYENRDKYDLSGNSIVPKQQKQEEKQTTKQSWKDYQQ